MSSVAWFTVLVAAGRRSSGWPSWWCPSATPPGAWRRAGVETGQRHYPVDGGAAHRPAGRRAGRGVAAAAGRRARPAAGRCSALVLASQALRWWCIATLGRRWNTRVIVVPGLPRVRRRAVPVLPAPQLRRRRRRGVRAAAGAQRVGHRARVHGGQRLRCSVRLRVENAALATSAAGDQRRVMRDLVVAGGGPVGLATALLRRSGRPRRRGAASRGPV